MKQRQALKEANDIRGAVEWPTEPGSFYHFKGLLRKVIEANFDHPVVNSLEYSVDECKFYITLTYSSTLGGPWSENLEHEDKRTGFKLERLIEIDPLLHLTPQINDAIEAHEKLKERHNLIQILLNEHLGKE
jgi:hypothetical protein